MAATRLISIRGSKAQSVIKSLTERTDYVNNPEKTENRALVYIELNAEPDMENNAPPEPVAEEREDKRLYGFHIFAPLFQSVIVHNNPQ